MKGKTSIVSSINIRYPHPPMTYQRNQSPGFRPASRNNSNGGKSRIKYDQPRRQDGPPVCRDCGEVVRFVKIRGSETQDKPKGEWKCCEEHSIPVVDPEGNLIYGAVPHFIRCPASADYYNDYRARRAEYKAKFRAQNAAPDEGSDREYPPKPPRARGGEDFEDSADSETPF